MDISVHLGRCGKSLHPHVWAAVGLGVLFTLIPLTLMWKQPGSELTRQVIAVSQVSWSALLIHLTGGRIETHFHIFGSLAFLAWYMDVRVLVTATALIDRRPSGARLLLARVGVRHGNGQQLAAPSSMAAGFSSRTCSW